MSAKKGRIAQAADEQNRVVIAPGDRKAFGFASVAEQEEKRARADGPPFVVLKYYRAAFECFSHWTAEELKLFSSFIGKLRDVDWETTQRGGFQRKALDLAKIDATAAGHLRAVKEGLSDDISFFELRVSQAIRVHGFRAKDAFFLVLLDREHRVCPE
ncbi:hypothetical protein [Burkholderia gladioli]|uniref:hypothetical protein n=1 Tax=Burkholderia gladioli TaxID=28095 RepID=UPI001641E6A5|nr:hypothetical protein [Burkholderia gladioli]MDN7806935.1 hypothetical protein [Burkholderia gladioli]